MTLAFTFSDWINLGLHFLGYSLLAVGGGISVLPEMHRFLVYEQNWLSDAQFASSITVAQIAPGPNILFVALMGWNIGLNNQSTTLAVLGAILCLIAISLPSSLVTLVTTRWTHQHQHYLGVRAFKLGLIPLTIALIFSTVWLLLSPNFQLNLNWTYYLLGAVAFVLLWKTKLHFLWLLGIGAVLGGMGWV